jgi:hypothetical protein
MGWAERIITDAALAPYLLAQSSPVSADPAPDFRAQVTALITQQQAVWPMLREAMAGLAAVEYKPLDVRGSNVLAQFNPKRLASTSAHVDAAAIRQRPCFLCPDNLPPEEQGIAFGADLVVLCNPFPVLERHLVATSRRHTPQTIIGHFGALLDLAQALGAEYFALYNGPACGASAPDHLHFQACARARLPLIGEAERWERRHVQRAREPGVFALPGYRVNLLIARGQDREAMIAWLQLALTHLAAITESGDGEPLLNLVVTCDAERWTVYFFPRARHRPSCYDAEGEARLAVSPGAIDLAGVVVVPEAAHFARIGASDLEGIFAEVMLGEARFAELIARLESGGP